MFIKELLVEEIKKIDSQYEVEICGSYRRGAQTSGDIDVLLTHPSYVLRQKNKTKLESLLRPIVDKLESIGFVKDVIACGDSKFMVIFNFFVHEFS
jgi:DNA polymerase beta